MPRFSKGGMITQVKTSNIRIGIFLVALSVSGCGHLSYMTQAALGQSEILINRRSVERILADVNTPPALRQQLQTIRELRRFASDELGLPDNNSYRSYADLRRRYVLWNVVATPEFSLEPHRWCFPVAGCVAYRGYYKQQAALNFADELKARGDDVLVGGVAAYSTLGWFSDPVLNTFVYDTEERLAALLFHELAHQVAYVKGDTTFNESFATAVERAGVKRWLQRTGSMENYDRYLADQTGRQRVVELLISSRAELEALYADPDLGPEEMRRRKQKVFDRLQQAYWTGPGRASDGSLDGWFRDSLNNALLASISAYTELVPAFEKLLQEEVGDLAAFYRRVKKISAMEPEARRRALGLK